jgi:tRNA A37 threonylcarbamoyltransferase TsaD
MAVKRKHYVCAPEFKSFLQEELKLELNIEKTRVTHVNNGFDFLGFHVRRYVSSHDKPKLLVTPTEEANKRLKSKIKEMTNRKRFQDFPLLKFTALNAVLRGWIGYYCHCNAKETAKDLDFWVNERTTSGCKNDIAYHHAGLGRCIKCVNFIKRG